MRRNLITRADYAADARNSLRQARDCAAHANRPGNLMPESDRSGARIWREMARRAVRRGKRISKVES